MESLLAVGDAATVELTAAAVRRGAAILYPTATVFGLGGDPADPTLRGRIDRIKRRSSDKPYLLLTDEWDRLGDWILPPSELITRLMHVGCRLPLTILLDAGQGAPRDSVGPTGHIAVRRTQHEFCREVISASDRFLVSTSANRSGGIPPARFEDVEPGIIRDVDIAVKAPACLGTASTLVGVEAGELIILREGAASRETILFELEKD